MWSNQLLKVLKINYPNPFLMCLYLGVAARTPVMEISTRHQPDAGDFVLWRPAGKLASSTGHRGG